MGSCTALGVAAEAGAADCARLLVEYAAEPDAADAKGQTPLIDAAEGGHLEVAKVLLAKNGLRRWHKFLMAP